jgi:tRNA modification GTPase
LEDGASTIFAPASGQGRAAVAVIRISGPSAGLVARRLAGRVPDPRQAVVMSLEDPATGMPIDKALLLYFRAPASFTGEDVLEIQHHGGLAVGTALLDVLSAMPDLRPAAPGEFTKRAFLNGKLDLTQAEGLADLIDATTMAQARAALRQLSGAQGRLYSAWRETVLHALAMLEAEIDFAVEDEVPEALWLNLAPDIEALAIEIRHHLADGHRGERLRRGLVVAVTGAPNVGKSSLVNALARRDVAIVTAVPGTTRDVIEVALDLEGFPITLLDTAGLRESDDPIEIEGIARARARAADADLRLLVVDDPIDSVGTERGEPPAITVLNKVDLLPAGSRLAGGRRVSAATGEGVDDLLRDLAHVARQLLPAEDSVSATRARHRSGLDDAAAALERALTLGGERDLGLLAEEIRLAARAIGRVTGAFGVEDILDRVFGSFCIGK